MGGGFTTPTPAETTEVDATPAAVSAACTEPPLTAAAKAALALAGFANTGTGSKTTRVTTAPGDVAERPEDERPAADRAAPKGPLGRMAVIAAAVAAAAVLEAALETEPQAAAAPPQMATLKGTDTADWRACRRPAAGGEAADTADRVTRPGARPSCEARPEERVATTAEGSGVDALGRVTEEVTATPEADADAAPEPAEGIAFADTSWIKRRLSVVALLTVMDTLVDTD